MKSRIHVYTPTLHMFLTPGMLAPHGPGWHYFCPTNTNSVIPLCGGDEPLTLLGPFTLGGRQLKTGLFLSCPKWPHIKNPFAFPFLLAHFHPSIFSFVSPFPHSYPYLQPGRHRACSEITFETKGSHGSVSGQTPSRVQHPQAPPTVLSSRPPHPFISIPSPSPLH